MKITNTGFNFPLPFLSIILTNSSFANLVVRRCWFALFELNMIESMALMSCMFLILFVLMSVNFSKKKSFDVRTQQSRAVLDNNCISINLFLVSRLNSSNFCLASNPDRLFWSLTNLLCKNNNFLPLSLKIFCSDVEAWS